MKTLKRTLLTFALGGLLAGAAVAQTNNASTTTGGGPGVYDPNHPRVNQINRREQRQQNRIANGIKNDKLTPQQASNLEKREARLQNREQRDMARDNGHLTKKDQRQLNRQENHISRRIYKDKHS